MRERATKSVRLRFFETSLEVAFDHADAAAYFSKRYRRFACDEVATLRIAAIRDDAGAFFFVDNGSAYRWQEGPVSALELGSLADCIMDEQFFRNTSTMVCLHAATMALDDVAFAVTAPSQGGKTTTAVACARRGMPLYSDEWCIFDGSSVHPFPRALNLRQGSLDLLGSECLKDPVTRRLRTRQGEDWRNVDFTELFGELKVPEPRPLAAIFFIDGREAMPRIEPFSAAEAIPDCSPPHCAACTADRCASRRRSRCFPVRAHFG